MAQPTRNREELISSFAGKLFSAMLEEVVMDIALQSHREAVRAKAICEVCGTRCGAVHTQSASLNGSGPSTSTSLPVPSSPLSTGKTVAGTSTPIAKDRTDGNIYFECTNCQKKIASNRYAPHLSGCLGIGTGSRRGAARNAASKNKLGVDIDRSASPFVGSEYGSPPQETLNGKRGKVKNSKKINGKATDSDINSNRKRTGTPDGLQPKKNKKQKTIASDSGKSTFVPSDTNTHKHRSYVPTPAQILTKAGATPPYAAGSPGSGASISHSPSSTSGSSHTALSLSPKPSREYITMADPGQRHGHPPSSAKDQTTAMDPTLADKSDAKEDYADFIDVDGEDLEESSSDSD